jgi:hypothetical protein
VILHPGLTWKWCARAGQEQANALAKVLRPELFGWIRKIYSGGREADVVMSSATMTPEVEMLTKRVGRLERGNRLLKLIGIGCALGVTVLLLVGADKVNYAVAIPACAHAHVHRTHSRAARPATPLLSTAPLLRCAIRKHPIPYYIARHSAYQIPSFFFLHFPPFSIF